jgi:glycosyltransferase involved in cell wall biosynthesis
MVRGEQVIAVSEMIRDYILDNYHFVDPDAISVIYRGVDASQYKHGFKPSKDWTDEWFSRFPQMQGKQLLTMPGRLTRWKGQLDFISIIHKLIQSEIDVHGVIVGAAHATKGNYEDELIRKIDQLGLNNHISLVGHRTDLKEILAVSTIVFSLSTEPEAFGRTTIEALSLGTPVIGYSHGGVMEQLEKLFPEGAIKVGAVNHAVAKAEKWLTNPPATSNNTKFTLDKMCMQTINVYNNIIKTSNSL